MHRPLRSGGSGARTSSAFFAVQYRVETVFGRIRWSSLRGRVRSLRAAICGQIGPLPLGHTASIRAVFHFSFLSHRRRETPRRQRLLRFFIVLPALTPPPTPPRRSPLVLQQGQSLRPQHFSMYFAALRLWRLALWRA